MDSKSKPTVREWCQQNYEKYKAQEELIVSCVKALGVRKKQVVKILRTLGSSGSSVETIGLSENELRAKCDVLFKIEAAIKKIPMDRYIPDAEFREFFCQVNASKYRSKADLPQFEKYKGVANGVTYWARPENIKRLKESGVFS
jgi:hypothetical protein